MEMFDLNIIGTLELKRIMAAAQKELFNRRLRTVEIAMGRFQRDQPRAASLPVLQERLGVLKRTVAKPTFTGDDEGLEDVLSDLEFWMEVED